MATDVLSAGHLLHGDDSQAQDVRTEQQAISTVMEQQRKVNLQRSQERSDQREDSKTRGLLVSAQEEAFEEEVVDGSQKVTKCQIN